MRQPWRHDVAQGVSCFNLRCWECCCARSGTYIYRIPRTKENIQTAGCGNAKGATYAEDSSPDLKPYTLELCHGYETREVGTLLHLQGGDPIAILAHGELSLEGMASGAGEGGAEDVMEEVVLAGEGASDDSREWTTRSSSVAGEEPAPQPAPAPPALALMPVMQVMPGMHGQPDAQAAQLEASGAPPQQQQPQPDHAPVLAQQAGPVMYVLPPPQAAQPYESEAQRQHSAAAALWHQQQQQQQAYRQCDMLGCQQWCPWNDATGVFYAHCSQEHQWQCGVDAAAAGAAVRGASAPDAATSRAADATAPAAPCGDATTRGGAQQGASVSRLIGAVANLCAHVFCLSALHIVRSLRPRLHLCLWYEICTQR